MNRTGLFTGLQGKRDAQPKKNLQALYRGEGAFTNRKVNLGYVGYKVGPKTFSQVIDYSTRRGVNPCFNINHFVIRTPPRFTTAFGQGQPSAGNGRTTGRSMVNPRPQNLPILLPRSNLAGAEPSPLGLGIRA